MESPRLHRPARLRRGLAVAAGLLLALAPAAAGADDAAPQVPPLNDPATDLRIPGKRVWADLFTSDVDGARRFYGELFGWQWREVSVKPERRYGLFLDADGEPVAGVAFRRSPDPEVPYARWVYYFSTPDVEGVLARVKQAGGRVMLPRREVAERGTLAVAADPEGAPFGLLRSSSGDPPDERADVGDWLWVGLFARDAPAACQFYASLFGYGVRPRQDPGEPHDFVLTAGGFWRAGVGQLRADTDNRPTWLGFVRVEDLDATAARAEQLGAEQLYVTESREPGEALAIYDDPFGAPFAFLPWRYPEEGPSAGGPGATP